MPLEKPKKGATKKQKQAVASRNIAKEKKAGKPTKQAIAIGLKSAGLNKSKAKKKRKYST